MIFFYIQDKLKLSDGAMLTMKKELQCTVKELSNKSIDNKSLESTLVVSEQKNQELCEQLSELQQEVLSCIKLSLT